ncbi:MAG: hypothetical protein NC313_04605 [Butyrivibrio sp.]|nr:hypothetical protein [Butyrivibrio sp.]
MYLINIYRRFKKTAVGNIIDTNITYPIMKVIFSIWNWFRLYKYKWKESKKCFGKLYPDRTFYVIRVRPITSSLGPLVMRVCKQLETCDIKEYIPVVDFSFFQNVFLEKGERGG